MASSPVKNKSRSSTGLISGAGALRIVVPGVHMAAEPLRVVAVPWQVEIEAHEARQAGFLLVACGEAQLEVVGEELDLRPGKGPDGYREDEPRAVDPPEARPGPAALEVLLSTVDSRAAGRCLGRGVFELEQGEDILGLHGEVPLVARGDEVAPDLAHQLRGCGGQRQARRSRAQMVLQRQRARRLARFSAQATLLAAAGPATRRTRGPAAASRPRRRPVPRRPTGRSTRGAR